MYLSENGSNLWRIFLPFEIWIGTWSPLSQLISDPQGWRHLEGLKGHQLQERRKQR